MSDEPQDEYCTVVYRISICASNATTNTRRKCLSPSSGLWVQYD